MVWRASRHFKVEVNTSPRDLWIRTVAAMPMVSSCLQVVYPEIL